MKKTISKINIFLKASMEINRKRGKYICHVSVSYPDVFLTKFSRLFIETFVFHFQSFVIKNIKHNYYKHNGRRKARETTFFKKHKEENKNEIVNEEVQREKLEPRHVEEF